MESTTLLFWFAVLTAFIIEAVKRWLRLVDTGAFVLTLVLCAGFALLASMPTFNDRQVAGEGLWFLFWFWFIGFSVIFSVASMMFKFKIAPNVIDIATRLLNRLRGRSV